MTSYYPLIRTKERDSCCSFKCLANGLKAAGLARWTTSVSHYEWSRRLVLCLFWVRIDYTLHVILTRIFSMFCGLRRLWLLRWWLHTGRRGGASLVVLLRL
jgi:hypothetical protein